MERLKLLLVLTIADIKAVGPGVWTGWKGELLRTLYYETEVVLGGGAGDVARSDRVRLAQERLRGELADWPQTRFDAYAARHYPAYWLKVEQARQVKHARFVREAEAAGRTVATACRDRPVPRRDGAHRAVAGPSAPARHHHRRLRGGRRQHRRRADLHDRGRHGARHDRRLARLRPGRGRAAPGRAGRLRRSSGRSRARSGSPTSSTASGPARSAPRTFHVAPEVVDRQRAVEPPDRDRGLGARPAGPALRPHDGAGEAQPQHRLGPYRDLRREGGGRVLRDGPDRARRSTIPAARRPSAGRCSRCSKATRRQSARRSA